MSTCPQCELETVPHTEFCLVCGTDGADATRRRRRFTMTGESATDREGLLRLLGALVDAPSASLRWLVDAGRLEIDATVTTAQGAVLERMLTAAGLWVRADEPTLADANQSLRWGGDRTDTVKILATAVIAAVTLALGVPLVAPVGLVTAVVLGARRLRLVPHRLALRPGVLERSIGIDATLLTEAHAACKRLSDPLVLSTLRASVEHVADMAEALRAEGASFVQPEVARVDVQVHDLLRRVIRFALAADRLGGSPDDPTPVVLDQAVRDQLDGHLVEVQRALARLRTDVQEIRILAARGRALASSKRALIDLRARLDAALELAAAHAPR